MWVVYICLASRGPLLMHRFDVEERSLWPGKHIPFVLQNYRGEKSFPFK